MGDVERVFLLQMVIQLYVTQTPMNIVVRCIIFVEIQVFIVTVWTVSTTENCRNVNLFGKI